MFRVSYISGKWYALKFDPAAYTGDFIIDIFELVRGGSPTLIVESLDELEELSITCELVEEES